MMTFSSRFFENDKASQWLELLHTRLHWPVVFDTVDEEAFEADIDCFSVGNVYLLNHSTSPLALQRSVATGPGVPQYFSLNFVTHGRMVLSHHDRQNILNGGDIVLADSLKPSRLTFEDSTRVITVRIPGTLLTTHIPQAERLCNFVMTPRHDFTKAIRAAMLSLLEMGRKGAPEELLERSIQPFLGMLSFSYLANFGHHIDRRRPFARNRLSVIRQYIDDNVTDGNLTPESIAAKFGLSTRYLRKLFATEGSSATRYIQRRRLEKSADKMSNLLWKEQSITDICYDCGFKSAPHFSRAFKAAFGVTPKEYRKRVSCLGRRA
jgi:AraC-like DNA-binding protein